jgi:methyl-accepting chemotaxis protein
VRKLAERTTQATQEIGGMIGQVQNFTRDAASGMETVVTDMRHLVALTEHAGGAMNHIAEQSETVKGLVGSITLALTEQSAASNDIARRVETIAQMSEENSAAVQQTATAANAMERVAAALQASVRHFRLA